MNPFATVSWFWRAWRARSITFAALFAFALFGISVLGWFRHLLGRLGAPWYVWLLVPIAMVSIIARKEADWVPDAEVRRKWALGLIITAILLTLLVGRLTSKPAESPEGGAFPTSGRADPHGR
jgi:hypothetical protein